MVKLVNFPTQGILHRQSQEGETFVKNHHPKTGFRGESTLSSYESSDQVLVKSSSEAKKGNIVKRFFNGLFNFLLCRKQTKPEDKITRKELIKELEEFQDFLKKEKPEAKEIHEEFKSLSKTAQKRIINAADHKKDIRDRKKLLKITEVEIKNLEKAKKKTKKKKESHHSHKSDHKKSHKKKGKDASSGSESESSDESDSSSSSSARSGSDSSSSSSDSSDTESSSSASSSSGVDKKKKSRHKKGIKKSSSSSKSHRKGKAKQKKKSHAKKKHKHEPSSSSSEPTGTDGSSSSS